MILGGGIAGMVLHHFLESESSLIVDPAPDAYKIGESIIPAFFAHPELRTLAGEACARKSWSPKHGTTFIASDSVASFPLQPEDLPYSMHIARTDLDSTLREAWNPPILREAVCAIDLDKREIRTTNETIRVRKQILDCSGPAMLVARHLNEVEEFWPVWARWTYFDIAGIDNQKFWDGLASTGRKYLRYDPPNRSMLPGKEFDGWAPSKTTILTLVEPGTWTWQIPLQHETLLSFGVVSKQGPVTDERLLELAERTRAWQYELRPRPFERGSPYNRIHARGRFACHAKTAATEAYLLVADAYAFADPVYSIGTGLAVNKAIEVARRLRQAPWDADAARQYCDHYARFMHRAVAAFDTWYHDELFRRDDAPGEIQEGFLRGTAFQVAMATQYSRFVETADLQFGQRDCDHD